MDGYVSFKAKWMSRFASRSNGATSGFCRLTPTRGHVEVKSNKVSISEGFQGSNSQAQTVILGSPSNIAALALAPLIFPSTL